MKMTFKEYINNPMGIKNSVFSNREIYRNLYKEKLDKILVRESGKINYVLYKNKNIYIVHIKVPSEVVKKFYYDVVLQFYPMSSKDTLSTSISNYGVKFFSNDPSFVYTFAHAMITNKMYIMDLIPKMSKEAISTVAKVRNPKNEIGYVKSIYFAYLIMQNYKLFDKIKFTTEGKPYNKILFLKTIMHSDEKIRLRQEKANEQEKIKKKSKTIETKPTSRERTTKSNENITNIKSSSSDNKIKSINKFGNSKKSKKVKSI